MKIGRSCSERAITAPSVLAWRAAAIDDFRPPMTGLARLARVTMAAAPMAPAPIMRTCLLQTPSAMSAADRSGIGCIDVISGTSTPQAITRPTSIAMPTVMPIRWPAPISASELEAPMPVAPWPVRK